MSYIHYLGSKWELDLVLIMGILGLLILSMPLPAHLSRLRRYIIRHSSYLLSSLLDYARKLTAEAVLIIYIIAISIAYISICCFGVDTLLLLIVNVIY